MALQAKKNIEERRTVPPSLKRKKEKRKKE
jgi:hypothetical protein